MPTEINRHDISAALDLFEKLEYGKGKAAAQTVVNCVVSQFTSKQIAPARENRNKRYFTEDEIRFMREGNKLMAVKYVRNRTGKSLMQSKTLVETKGVKFLMESGEFGANGFLLPQS